MRTATIRLALDKSARTVDENGFMHVAVSNISKATVNPYNGEDIQNWEELGLDPKRTYFMLRDPQELAKAAASFNNLPLLDFHEPLSAEEFDEKREFVVGATGTDARFVDPYLQNSLVIWEASAIEGIESRKQVELSCAYRFVADMTPGKFNGVAYDGVMRELKGNHVALVDEGRAGPDVVVGDAKPKENTPMKTKLTPRAVAVRGALLGSLRSKLAQDQKLKIADLNALVAPITAKGYKTQKAKLAQDIKAAFKGKLAQDANLDDIMDLLDNLDDGEGEGMEEDALPKKDPNAPDQPAQAPKLPNAKDEGDEVEDACAKDGDEAGKALLALLQAQNLPDDVMSQVAGLLEQLSTPKPAVDGFPPKKGAPVPAVPPQPLGKPAMDAAIKAAEQATITRMNGIRRAEEKVEPLVGKLQPGMESAEAVFKFALDSAHIETANIHPSAFEVLVDVLLDRADAPQPVGLIAMDKAAGDSYETKYHASRLKR